MLQRTIFNDDHNQFRDAFRKFVEAEIVPHHEQWEADQQVSRELWLKAGEQGFLCPTIAEEYGGAGVDRLFSVIVMEELARANAAGPGFALHSDIVAPYIVNYGTEEQKKKFLPPMVRGELIGAIAMTEPSTGSDLQAIRTRAVIDGDEVVLDGSKIFITNGYMSDLVVVACQLVDPDKGDKPQISLLLVESDRAGFTKEKPLKKMGQKAQDTCVLNFDGVRVPRENILGGDAGIGKGIPMLFGELAWERLMIGVLAVAGAEFCFQQALSYTRERKAFGQPVADFQDVRFTLAEMRAKISVGQAYVDQCLAQMLDGHLGAEDAATAKYWCSDMACEVADEAVQLHGGYGYMLEYPVSRAFTDLRAHRIYGGTNAIMKELIARSL